MKALRWGAAGLGVVAAIAATAGFGAASAQADARDPLAGQLLVIAVGSATLVAFLCLLAFAASFLPRRPTSRPLYEAGGAPLGRARLARTAKLASEPSEPSVRPASFPAGRRNLVAPHAPADVTVPIGMRRLAWRHVGGTFLAAGIGVGGFPYGLTGDPVWLALPAAEIAYGGALLLVTRGPTVHHDEMSPGLRRLAVWQRTPSGTPFVAIALALAHGALHVWIVGMRP